jgi:glycosyltransferase involved in cell wall biosynthesis
MGSTPKVSFITTAYNAAPFLAESVTSMLATDWPDFEIVLVDDGSSDDTAAIGRDLVAEDGRVRCFELGRRGRSRALNEAIRRARGTYLAIQDADDFTPRHRLKVCVPILEADPNLALVAGATELQRDRGALRAFATAPPHGDGRHRPVSLGELYANNFLQHSSILFRKSAWEACGGYNEAMQQTEDWEFYFRMLSVGGIALTDEITALRHVRADTFFKKRSVGAYAAAILQTRRTAHRLHRIPIAWWPQNLRILRLVASKLALEYGLTRPLGSVKRADKIAGADGKGA